MTETAGKLPEPEWWGQHWGRYNLRLVLAALLVFAAQASILFTKTEITAFTLAYMVVSYIITIGIANIGYFLGPIAERILKPNNVVTYRRVTYNLIFWFFVVLIFMSPLIVGSVVNSLASTKT